MNRRKLLAVNSVTSLLYQIATIVCGFILPRLILGTYGSEVNGLVNSITQFLAVISFLEMGVGAVVQSSLYKPLAEKNNEEISKIISSANKFFSKIALVLLVYVIALLIIYPEIINGAFNRWYVDLLIIAISISSFAQYYFGVVDTLLITADQHGYVQYIINTFTLIFNSIFCAVLIRLGASIQLVKLTTSIIFLIKPVLLRLYVNKKYKIDRKIKYKGEPIKQKWNGIAQHVASIVLDQTDIIVLTIFSTLSNISIYSVYHLVIYGIKNLFLSVTNGFRSLMGEMIAKNEKEELNKLFEYTEWLLHTGTTLIFGITGVLIIPFVEVYTKGITDINYNVPLFAALITVANAGHCLRLPYNLLILAAGHYKQTQSNYIIATMINIFISIISVRIFGLIGVAIGTLCAMFYQTIWMAIYDSDHILNRPISSFIKHLFVDVITVVIASLLSYEFHMSSVSYFSWLVLAIKVGSIWAIVTFILNMIFYGGFIKNILKTDMIKSKR